MTIQSVHSIPICDPALLEGKLDIKHCMSKVLKSDKKKRTLKQLQYQNIVLEEVLSGSEQKHVWSAHGCRKGLHAHAPTDKKKSPLTLNVLNVNNIDCLKIKRNT